ncbi:MobP2 family relaxase [Clostridium sardiniense]|uniref:MobP2 family relaxase n=1 Tax=Clostridium sardiniense TaxID=29369 RepID=UPI00195E95EF|nr:MobP2 family relaxase [Clostridium sardiniense]MBM7835600.1 hypothetical protein [Clostridium sardiniense]
MSKISPAIVHRVRWVAPKGSKFNNYIKYMDRDEATRNFKFDEFSLYNDYMGNPKKSGSLFTNEKDFMSKKEVLELKKKFELSQKRKSMMWQDVFSFNNDWLIEHGYFNPKTKVLDEKKIRDAIRKSMSELVKEKGSNDLIWSASIHYNTKHIHIHVASVELNPQKENLKLPVEDRGKIKLSTLKTMKSKFINEMRNRDEFYKELDVLARDNMIGSKKEYSFMKDRVLREKMLGMLKYMPKDKRQWNYERIKEAKPYINSLTKYYLDNFCKEDLKNFNELLEIDRAEQIKIYGVPKDTRKLKETHYKEKDLYKRMGNTILKELKDFVKEEEYKNKRLEYLKNKKKFKKGKYKTSNHREKKFSKDNVIKDNNIKLKKENAGKEKEDNNNVKVKDIKNIKFHDYSVKNSMLIREQCPKATSVGSDSLWKEKGYRVKDGEKGIEIYLPVKEDYFMNNEGIKTNVKKATKKEKELIKNGKINVIEGRESFEKSYVFDISQTVPIENKSSKVLSENNSDKGNENINNTINDDKLNKELKSRDRYSNVSLTGSINNLKRSMRNELQHYLNMRDFERMELQKDYDNGLSL